MRSNRSPRADLLIVTTTEVESRAVMQVFREATGNNARPQRVGDRVYHELGQVNGTRVLMALSEMGSGGLGASLQAVQKAIEAPPALFYTLSGTPRRLG